MPVDSVHRKACALPQPLYANPTTVRPSLLTPVAWLKDASQGPALPGNEPSSRHSVPRIQIAACWMPRASLANPTIVCPSLLTPDAYTPPAKITPVVGIQ